MSRYLVIILVGLLWIVRADAQKPSINKSKLQKLSAACQNADESACKELRINCIDKVDKGASCTAIGAAMVYLEDFQGAQSWFEQGCENGDKGSCDVLPSANRIAESKSRESELRDLELQRARLEVENARLQQQNLRRQNAASQQIDYTPLVNFVNTMNPPPAPKPKNIRCTSSVNSNFNTIDTNCNEN